ncbi:MAG: RagB/SusD family nutrient uptake outer membrane protein [Bacteroidales bacterium]|nr:MAG: RagB/SusD family nutrient uptake outer membrane protein [Bacteroidales bacterium]
MKIKTYILGLIALLTTASCEKMFEVDQPDIIEQDQAFSDKNSTRLSLIGIYGLMAELVEPMFLAGEVRADLVIANKSADPYIKEYSNNSFSSSNPYSSPKPFYTIINNTNDFINEFEGKLANQEMDTTDFIKYKSELVATRVWSQYQIAKIYGSCKYYTEVLNTEDSSEIINYSFEDTAFLRILINDLTYSDTNNFTSSSEELAWQTARFSDYYVNALMGELYMDIGEYENAIQKFDEVLRWGDFYNLAGNRFKITSTFDFGWQWFVEFFMDEWETSELVNNAVFLIAFDNKYNQSNELWNWTLSLDYQVAPSGWYIDKFEEHAYPDGEERDWRVLSIENWFSDFRSPYAITKYQENDRPFIMTRTARIQLLKIYCNNATGNNSLAEFDLNWIRRRIPFSDVNFDDMPEDPEAATEWLEDIIIDEMAYETGFEGQRWFDLMRVALRRNDPSYLADRVAQKYPEESREKIRTKLMDKANWYIPVYE